MQTHTLCLSEGQLAVILNMSNAAAACVIWFTVVRPCHHAGAVCTHVETIKKLRLQDLNICKKQLFRQNCFWSAQILFLFLSWHIFLDILLTKL